MSHANFKSIQTRTEAETFLRDHGITPTRQRIEVARTLFARPQHFSADQVAASLSSEGATVSKATVYNTLEDIVGVEYQAADIFAPGGKGFIQFPGGPIIRVLELLRYCSATWFRTAILTQTGLLLAHWMAMAEPFET